MTLEEAKEKLRKVGMVLSKKDGEYRVNFPNGKEETAYYTPDIEDAVATGEELARVGVGVERRAAGVERRAAGSPSPKFTTYRSWHEVMQDARAGETLFYHAPLDRFPVRLTKGSGGPYTYEVMARGVRIYPPGSSGRGKQRTSDPFTANAEHLERFRRPTSAPRVDTTLPAPRLHERKPYAEQQFEGPRSAEGVHKLLGQLDAAHVQRYDILRCAWGNCVHETWYQTMTQAEHEAEIVSKRHGSAEVFIEHNGERIALCKNGRRVK